MTHHPDHEVELFKEEDAYEVYVDLPGYERGQVSVRWHDGRLHVEAEDHEDGAKRVYSRHVSVPREIDESGIAATYEEEVLEVHLPILDGESHPGREIEIEG
jgi:HSP20 family protein